MVAAGGGIESERERERERLECGVCRYFVRAGPCTGWGCLMGRAGRDRQIGTLGRGNDGLGRTRGQGDG